MTAVLVDSNVFLDVFTEDAVWLEWSSAALADAGNAGRLVINPIIYAEISIRFSQMEELDELLAGTGPDREPVTDQMAFLAGKAYIDYRRRGGLKRSPLPDFFIGAHAAIAGYSLLTRDPLRYRSYFPKLAIITPDTTP